MSDAISVRCSSCGSPMRPTKRLPRGRRLARWFASGRDPAGQRSYECDVCGMGASVGALYTHRHGPLRGRRLRELYAERTMQPVPRFYAIMTAGGAAIGAAWSVLLSWRWWLGPLLAVIGGWVFMTSTIFWHPRWPTRRQGRP